MLTAEAEQLIAHASELWTTWRPTDALVGFWRKNLRGMDYTDSLRAVEEHFGESNRASPVFGQVKGKYETLRHRRSGERPKPDNCGMTGVWIQSVEAPPRFPNRLGRFLQVIFGQDRNVPGRDTIMAVAENMRAQHEMLYGGCWIVLDGWTRKQIEEEKTRLVESAKHQQKHTAVSTER